ncbi:MAG: phosphoribosyltransferase family protein [Chitinophagales bacterium]|nr:phosphoribosyltransferase family protein [Chitinophagales bacterium]
MPTKKTAILDATAIGQKVHRIAYQILEENDQEKEISLIGIKDNGFVFAQRLAQFINNISKVKVNLYFIALDKTNPDKGSVNFDFEPQSLAGKAVIIVDDVANTGKTLAYAIKPLLDFPPKKIQIAVLVDRKHKLFPISTDFVGLSLSTTMQEHIRVELGKEDMAYLV